MYHEKRELFRIPIEEPVEVALLSLPDGHKPPRITLAARTSDVSEDGMRITLVDHEAVRDVERLGLTRHSVHVVPPGAKVRVRIKPAGYWRHMTHVGTVRWVQEEPDSPVFVFGVELTDTPKPIMRRWFAYLQRARSGQGARGSR